MPEEYDLNLQPTVNLNVENRKAAKEAGQRAFEEDTNPEYIAVSGGKQNKYKPGWTKAFNRGYTDRKENDYRYTPDEVYIDRMRHGDTSALPELMHKKSDNTAPYLAAGLFGFPAAVMLGGEAIPLITGASALSPGVAAALTRASNVVKPAVKAVGEFVEPVLNNPVSRFYFSRPVQGAKAIATAAPMAYNWAVKGEKPSNTDLTKWGIETGLGVGLGGNWGEASKAAYEIPGYVKGIGNEIAQTTLKGYARFAPEEALKWTKKGIASPLKGEINNYLNSVSPQDQKWFNKTFSAEELQNFIQANIDNFNMRLWPDPFTLGVTDKERELLHSYFRGEQLSNPKISIRGGLSTTNAKNTAMHEYHHAADDIAKKIQKIEYKNNLQFFPGNVNHPIYFYNPIAELNEKAKRGFIISDRFYYPLNFPMNYRKIDNQIKALEEHPGIFNRRGGKLIKRYF